MYLTHHFNEVTDITAADTTRVGTTMYLTHHCDEVPDVTAADISRLGVESGD